MDFVKIGNGCTIQVSPPPLGTRHCRLSYGTVDYHIILLTQQNSIVAQSAQVLPGCSLINCQVAISHTVAEKSKLLSHFY